MATDLVIFVVRYAVGGHMLERTFTDLDAAQSFAANAGGFVHRRRGGRT